MTYQDRSKDPSQEIQFRKLLEEAVTKPGTVMKAYSLFWNYSLGNQLLALMQAAQRGLTVGPIASYTKWQSLGRQVRRGERAIVLCRPVTLKRKATEADAEGNEQETESTFTRFVFKPYWFFVSQTSGQEYIAPPIPAWDRTKALTTLGIEEIPFALPSGNTQGYSTQNKIAVSPIAAMPHRTTFHEMAHVLLGHTTEAAVHDSDITPRCAREMEAECVAMLCCEALGLPGIDEARGYVQGWWGAGNPIPEKSAQKILACSDRILKAGIERQAQGGAE
jgi:antirestriction protein ArdC